MKLVSILLAVIGLYLVKEKMTKVTSREKALEIIYGYKNWQYPDIIAKWETSFLCAWATAIRNKKDTFKYTDPKDGGNRTYNTSTARVKMD